MRMMRFFRFSSVRELASVRGGCCAGLVAVVWWLAFFQKPDAVVVAQILTKRMAELKVESTRQWAGAEVGGEKVSPYASARACLLVSGKAEITLPERYEKGAIALAIHGEVRSATAVPISEDGYVLTAAHCLDAKEITLIVKNPKVVLEKAIPRVVWKGRFKDGDEPDLAVLHVPVRFEHFFNVEEVGTDVENGTLVYSNGFGAGTEAVSVGKVIGWEDAVSAKSGTDLRWRILRHTGPLTRGDSGGAIFGTDGRLIGINLSIHGTVNRWVGIDHLRDYHMEAVLPDWAWVKRLLQEDRLRRGKAAPGDGKQ